MKLSRERIVLFAVLGVGAAGLFVDRVLLGYDSTSPSSASASVTASSEAASAADKSKAAVPAGRATVKSAQKADNAGTEISALWHERMSGLADLLDQAVPIAANVRAPQRDLFGGDADWLRPKPVETPKAKAQMQKPPFEDRFHLEAVLGSPSGVIAIINGRNYKLGSTIDGYKLASIDQSKRVVVFVKGDERVSLGLDQ